MPVAEGLLQRLDVGDVREQAQLDLRVVGRQQHVPGSATKARRILRPSSVRIGMFCRLGSVEDSRPVDGRRHARTRCGRGPVLGLICSTSASA